MITNKIYLLLQKFCKIENEIRLWMLVRSIINSITSREKVTLSVLLQCRWLNYYLPMYFYDYFLQLNLWLNQVLKKYSFAIRTHIQWLWIDSYHSFCSCWKFKFCENTRTKNWFELNTAKSACNNLKFPFFSTSNPLKKHLCFWKIFEKRGNPPP